MLPLAPMMSEIIDRLFNYNLRGWYRYLRLKITHKHVKIGGSCSMCGACCSSIKLQSYGRSFSSKKRFLQLSNEYPELERFQIIDRDYSGNLRFRCQWLKPDHSCQDHEQRLPICHSFPEPEMYFTGAVLPKECSYTFVEENNFSWILKKAQHKLHSKESHQD
ncbi:MAG: YkgJ family cysteine cluster protein [Gammaproteobacteria bacterium]|nr:YkgJ family cysteine cluster protein [Gammaproteobacteria bacterium]